MIGKLVSRCIELDYTAVAAPLSIESVIADINEHYAKYCASPEIIVLWEHQWNWMTKDVDNTGSYLCGTPDDRIGYKAIIGIRVRMANA